MDHNDQIALIAGSEYRVEILKLLSEKRVSKSEILSNCTASRSSTHRILEELLNTSLIKKEGEDYRLTISGEKILEQYTTLENTIEMTTTFNGIYDSIDESDKGMNIPTWVFEEATCINSTDEYPLKPLREFTTIIKNENPDQFRGITPVRHSLLDDLREFLLKNDTNISVITDTKVICENNNVKNIRDDLQNDNFSVYLDSNLANIGLTISDVYVIIGAYNRGFLSQIAVIRSAESYDWASQYFEHKVNESKKAKQI